MHLLILTLATLIHCCSMASSRAYKKIFFFSPSESELAKLRHSENFYVGFFQLGKNNRMRWIMKNRAGTPLASALSEQMRESENWLSIHSNNWPDADWSSYRIHRCSSNLKCLQELWGWLFFFIFVYFFLIKHLVNKWENAKERERNRERKLPWSARTSAPASREFSPPLS